MDRRSFLWKGAFGTLGAIVAIPSLGSRVQTAAARPLHLCTVSVAGTQYYHARSRLGIADIRSGEPLTLRREPANHYDGNAVEVYTLNGKKLGYIPRTDNTVIATMLDQGVLVYAVIIDVKASDDPWKRITIDVYSTLAAACQT